MDNKKIMTASLMITVFSILSKLLGVFRVMAINWQFGQGYDTDAYNAAIRLASVVMSIIASAIFTALVPILANIKERFGVRGKFKFFNNITNIVMLLTILLAVVVYIFAPGIIKIIYPGFTGEKFELTIVMVRMATPIILSLALMNLATAFIQSFNIYGPYAVMGIPYNLIFFIYLFFMPLSIRGLMIASCVANFSQFLIQAPAVFGTGYRYKPLMDFGDTFVNKTLHLVVPVAIGSAVQQINVIVDQTLASGLSDGIITAMDTASKVNDAIIAIFVTGITTVMFPVLSEAFEKKNTGRIVRLIDDGVGIIFLITLPSTIGIITMAPDLIKVMFERGAFTAQNTIITSDLLIFYTIGLAGAGMRMLFSKVYYSLHDTKTPMINGTIAVAINIVLNLILVRILEHKGLALATSVSVTVTTAMMVVGLKKRIKDISLKSYMIEFTKIGLSSVVMGAVVLVLNKLLMPVIPAMIRIIVVVGIAVVVYLAMIVITRVKSIVFFRDLLKRKLKKA